MGRAIEGSHGSHRGDLQKEEEEEAPHRVSLTPETWKLAAFEALTVPASKRPYLFNLVASANTHPSRRAWLDTAVGWLSTRCAFVFEAKEWMPHEQRGDRFASTFWQCRGRGRGVEGPVGISTVSANPMSYSEYRKALLRALAHAHP